MTCPTCNDTGRIVTCEFDGRTALPCPCRDADDRYAQARARLAQEFGSDQQRQRITETARRRPMAAPRCTEG